MDCFKTLRSIIFIRLLLVDFARCQSFLIFFHTYISSLSIHTKSALPHVSRVVHDDKCRTFSGEYSSNKARGPRKVKECRILFRLEILI